MKHINNYNNFINERYSPNKNSRKYYTDKIEKFIEEFPDEPKGWQEATDEIAELHYYMANYYNEWIDEGIIDGDKYEGHIGRSKTPKEWNTKAKKGIKFLMNKLPLDVLDVVINHFSFLLNESVEIDGLSYPTTQSNYEYTIKGNGYVYSNNNPDNYDDNK